MKTKYLFGAMAALMMTSCSQDEVVGIRQDGIAYSVSAETQTRAADSYCNKALPAYFKVWAKSAEGLYINGDKIKNNGGVWTDADGTRYWPDGKTLDFYAEVNGDQEFNFNNGAPSFNDFTVKDGVTEQLDLMYSVRKSQTKSNDKVQLNFRHALSQVCFKATNNTKNMKVVIKGVSVGHLTNKGTFEFPTENTDYNYVHHNDNPDEKTLNGGRWTIPTDAQYDKQYDVTPTAGDVTLDPGTVSNLTCPGDGHANGFTQVLTLLPQTVNAWNPKNAEKKYDGAYFLLDVVLSNITKDNAGAEVSTAVYTGKAAIPVRVEWAQGYRYIYTFVFDEGGNGGWTPYPGDPEPVLTSIKYDVTVDDFIPVNGDGGSTGMDTGDKEYAHTTMLRLYSNYGETETIKFVKLNSDSESYSFTLSKEYTPVREGYKFLGWATTVTATKADYTEGASVMVDMTKESTDLYAVWEQAKFKFKITYDLNGGTAGSQYEKEWSGNRTDGYVQQLSSGKAEKEGYTFLGWGKTDDATEAITNIKLDKNKPEVTVYAVWKKMTNQFKLIFNGVLSNVMNVPEALTYSGPEDSHTFTVPDVSNMTCGNYEFKGWADTDKVESVDDIKYKTDPQLLCPRILRTRLSMPYGELRPVLLHLHLQEVRIGKMNFSSLRDFRAI